MAVGFRSLAGFPLGAGVTNVPPAATVGFTSLFWWMGGLGAASIESASQHRSGGAGHQVRFNRYWKGKYAGYFNDIEWTEWLLAYLAGEVAEEPAKIDAKETALGPEIVEPEEYIEAVYPETYSALLDLKLDTVLALAEQHHNARVAKLAEAILFRKRTEEDDDDIETLLLEDFGNQLQAKIEEIQAKHEAAPKVRVVGKKLKSEKSDTNVFDEFNKTFSSYKEKIISSLKKPRRVKAHDGRIYEIQ